MVLLPGCTGVTRLIDTGMLVVIPFAVTFSVPVFAPAGRPVGFAVTVTVVPSGGSGPEAGFTERNGLSVVAVKVPVSSSVILLDAEPGMKTRNSTGVVLPTGTAASPASRTVGGGGSTTVEATSEYDGELPAHCVGRTR